MITSAAASRCCAGRLGRDPSLRPRSESPRRAACSRSIWVSGSTSTTTHDVEVVLLPGLDQQRDDVHDHGVGGAAASSSAARRRTAGWTIASRSRRAARRRTRSRPGPPGRAARRRQHVGAEALDDRGQPRRARLDHLTSQHVGVDHHRPARRQLVGDAVLPDAIPPVSPTRSTRAHGYGRRAARGGPAPTGRRTNGPRTPKRRRGPSGRSAERARSGCRRR